MLRISIQEGPRDLALRLEGRLAGPSVQVLEECWQTNLSRHCNSTLRVDLTGVTSIDDAGQACLTALYRQGAELIAADALTKAIVAEITQTNAN